MHFTSIKHIKAYSGDTDTLFNQVLVVDMTEYDGFDFIRGILTTSSANEKTSYKKIKKILEGYVNKKLSRYGGAVDLLEKIKFEVVE